MSIHLDPDTLGAGVQHATPAAPPMPTNPHLPIATQTGRIFSPIKTILTSAFVWGILLIFFLMGAERFAAADWKPSAIIGAFGGNQEAAHILTALEAQRALIAAQQQETARAQQQTIVVQAENERVTKAYEALYQRGNMMAQAWANNTAQILQTEMQADLRGLEGRMGVSRTKDSFAMWCDLGAVFSPDITCGDQLRESAANDRSAVRNEIMQSYKQKMAEAMETYKTWSEGLPDPAQMVAYKAKFDHLLPQDAAPTPAPPISKS
mgnify:FL=1